MIGFVMQNPNQMICKPMIYDEVALGLRIRGIDEAETEKRVEKALISIGRKDLNEMIQEGKEVELNCHFCNTNYVFSVEELKEILRKCR